MNWELILHWAAVAIDNWQEIFGYAVISIVSVVFLAFVASFAWFTLKDKAQSRRQAVPEVFPETPWLPEEMTAYAQAQAVKRKKQQELHDREVLEFRAELEKRAAR